MMQRNRPQGKKRPVRDPEPASVQQREKPMVAEEPNPVGRRVQRTRRTLRDAIDVAHRPHRVVYSPE